MILFLDFDGVLHPEDVYITPAGPTLRGSGSLFMWASMLEAELRPYPDIEIVLSTSWVRHLGFSRAKKRLPDELQRRVTGSTWHSSMSKVWADQDWWDQASRYGQIMRHVSRSKLTDWIALDDDGEGWGAAHRDRLVLTDGPAGLSSDAALSELRAKLTASGA